MKSFVAVATATIVISTVLPTVFLGLVAIAYSVYHFKYKKRRNHGDTEDLIMNDLGQNGTGAHENGNGNTKLD